MNLKEKIEYIAELEQQAKALKTLIDTEKETALSQLREIGTDVFDATSVRAKIVSTERLQVADEKKVIKK